MSIATNTSIVAIVLAAGAASRFGATKQLAEIDGAPLVNRAVSAAAKSKALTTAVVIGHDWQAVSAAIIPFDGFLIRNEDYAAGLATSLSLAVRATRHVADAIVVMLADQPLITSAHVNALIDRWSGSDTEIVATSFDGNAGPPALFGAGCFDDLTQLSGDKGARALLEDSRFNQQRVAFADAAVDVDRPADLSRLLRSARS